MSVRRWLLLLAAILLPLVAIRLCCLQGLVVPVRIAGGSMYGSLVGPHYRMTCTGCGFIFVCDATHFTPLDGAVCPNCGTGRHDPQPEDHRPGQRVLIDRAAYLFRSPARWELVAFPSPNRPGELEVKRVVGLPHEQLEIRGGDLYVDGRIVRKTRAELRRVAIFVHDQASPGPRAWAPRWAAEDAASSGWTVADGRLRHDGAGDSSRMDWVSYRHRVCHAGPAARDESPVRDDYGYNQGVSRALHQVHDLMLECELDQLEGAGRLAFRVHDGQLSWQLVWRPETGHVALHNGQTTVATAKVPRTKDRRVMVEYCVCDDQILFALGGRNVLSHSYQPGTDAVETISRPLAIGTSGVSLRLAKLRVLRDVHYLAAGGESKWTAPALAADEYLMFGDNVPIAWDSRYWKRAGIQRKSLVGKVLTVF